MKWLYLFSHFCFQGIDLKQDVRGGIIMGNQSLVLQSLKRNATGNYYCVASNAEGTAFSNPVSLDIKCKLKGYYLLYAKVSSFSRPYLIRNLKWF